jgi:hypothetical protein
MSGSFVRKVARNQLKKEMKMVKREDIQAENEMMLADAETLTRLASELIDDLFERKLVSDKVRVSAEKLWTDILELMGDSDEEDDEDDEGEDDDDNEIGSEESKES